MCRPSIDARVAKSRNNVDPLKKAKGGKLCMAVVIGRQVEATHIIGTYHLMGKSTIEQLQSRRLQIK